MLSWLSRSPWKYTLLIFLSIDLSEERWHLYLLGCQILPTRWLKPKKCVVSQSGRPSLRPRCLQAWFLLRPWRRSCPRPPSQLLGGLLAVVGALGLSTPPWSPPPSSCGLSQSEGLPPNFPSPIGWRTPANDPISTNSICNDCIYKSRHILRSWGLGLQHMNLGGDTIQPPVEAGLLVGFLGWRLGVEWRRGHRYGMRHVSSHTPDNWEALEFLFYFYFLIQRSDEGVEGPVSMSMHLNIPGIQWQHYPVMSGIRYMLSSLPLGRIIIFFLEEESEEKKI